MFDATFVNLWPIELLKVYRFFINPDLLKKLLLNFVNILLLIEILLKMQEFLSNSSFELSLNEALAKF